MALKNRSDLKAYIRTLIVEAQTSEEVTPEIHNQANDELVDSLLNLIDDLATEADFTTPNPLSKKYISPYQAFFYLLRKSDKATQAEVLAGLNDSKFVTPKGIANVLLGAHGLKDYVTSLSYAFGNGCFFDDGDGFKLYRCTNEDGTTGVFNPTDWEVIGGDGSGGGVTNLGYTASPTNGTVTSDTGTDATIPLADSTNAGLLKPDKFTVLENTTNTNSGNETASSIGALLTTDTAPLDSDFVVGWDGTFLLKTTWSNIKVFLKTYFDTVYQTVLSIVSDTEMQTGTENTKYVTALRITTWWTWIKTQTQTIAGTWTFSALLTSGANLIFTNTSTATASSDGIRRSAANTLAFFINAVDRVILTTTGVQMVGTILFSSLTGSATSVLNIDASGNVTRGLDIQSISTLRGRADVTVSGTSETTILTASDGTTLTINTGDINVLSARLEQSLRALYTTLTPSGTATFKIIWNSATIYTKVVDLNAAGLDGLTAKDFFVGVELTTAGTGSSGILRGVFTLRTLSTFLADETFTATGINLTVSSVLDLTITQSVANTWVTKIIDRKVI